MQRLIVKYILLFILLILLITGCKRAAQEQESDLSLQEGRLNKKLFLAISYHEEYSGSKIYTEVIGKSMEAAGVEVRTFYLDSKNITDEKLLQERALQAKTIIEEWQPDLIIATDDAINKYLIMPYYKNARLPIIFIGVNWDASVYGYPYTNVTGQVEVELIESLISELKKYAPGERLGFLSADSLTNKKSLQTYQERYNIDFEEIRLVNNFAAWKREYLALQEQVDILFLRNVGGIPDWNHEEALSFIKNNTKVITGNVNYTINQYALLSFCKLEREYAEYAAKTALEVLRGREVNTIPITTNVEAQVFINTTLAKRLNIKFPLELLERAHLTSIDKKRLLYINSYHRGYKWSDDIEKGLLKALNIKERGDGSLDNSASLVALRIFRMDSKMNTSESYIKGAALHAKTIIDDWQPDIVVTSDDNAAKYLIVPYYKDSKLPFVFCGINWDSSIYGFPYSNVTGMEEVTPILDCVNLIKNYVNGERFGFIGANNLSNRREMENIKKILNIKEIDGILVSTFEEWKEAYSSLQNKVDIIIWTAPTGILGWNHEKAMEYIYANTKIPTLGTSDDNVWYSMIGLVKIAEEQGWWAGKRALEILEGKSPSDIPITANVESRIYVNMRLTNLLGIKLPVEFLDKATFIDQEKVKGED